jgi:hypothetical protein
MAMFDRGPDGRFIDYGRQMAVWLPVLLEQYWDNPLVEMLNAACSYCDHEAASWYSEASTALIGKCGFSDPQARAELCSREAARWFARKQVLKDAIDRLGAIK